MDLAGSETLTYEFGNQQQKETKHINLSLTQLKTVITALSKKEKFIPYRNSALTKLLRKSLGGEHVVLRRACVCGVCMSMCVSRPRLQVWTWIVYRAWQPRELCGPPHKPTNPSHPDHVQATPRPR